MFGNVVRGIDLSEDGVVIQGNYFGTDPSGAQPLPIAEPISDIGSPIDPIRRRDDRRNDSQPGGRAAAPAT